MSEPRAEMLRKVVAAERNLFPTQRKQRRTAQPDDPQAEEMKDAGVTFHLQSRPEQRAKGLSLDGTKADHLDDRHSCPDHCGGYFSPTIFGRAEVDEYLLLHRNRPFCA
ncbi:MAG: hypothetical protein HYR56_24695, partial [Acidobacteria bacterium]|nr:hypothetical protein [Acidobacteriota bacterium]